MTRLPDDYLHITAFLYPSMLDAEIGAKKGGTGFFVRIESDVVQSFYTYLVTNRHVIEQGNTTVCINRHHETALILDSNEPDWIISDEHDLAICHFSVGNEERFSFKSFDHFIDRDTFTSLNIGLGEEVIVPGRLAGLEAS